MTFYHTTAGIGSVTGRTEGRTDRREGWNSYVEVPWWPMIGNLWSLGSFEEMNGANIALPKLLWGTGSFPFPYMKCLRADICSLHEIWLNLIKTTFCWVFIQIEWNCLMKSKNKFYKNMEKISFLFNKNFIFNFKLFWHSQKSSLKRLNMLFLRCRWRLNILQW